jgi:hypothetical protein
VRGGGGVARARPASSGRETLAAPRPSPLEDRAAGTGGHAGAEAVPPLPPAHVGLVGSLHESKRKEEPPALGAASGQYRRGARGHKRTPKRGAEAAPDDANVASTGKTVHTCGCLCGVRCFPCN